jgi:hypothetical protein
MLTAVSILLSHLIPVYGPGGIANIRQKHPNLAAFASIAVKLDCRRIFFLALRTFVESISTFELDDSLSVFVETRRMEEVLLVTVTTTLDLSPLLRCFDQIQQFSVSFGPMKMLPLSQFLKCSV